MKKISILVPTYNEEKNIEPLSEEIIKVLSNFNYDYEIIFIDNCSTDNTRYIIIDLCQKNKNVKAIFNSRNFGPLKNFYYGLTQITGDCAILIFADFQDPPKLIYEFIKEWENGYKVVIAKKTKSNEGIVSILRGVYYKIVSILSKIDSAKIISNFNGFGLYDKDFIDILRKIEDPEPYFKNVVGEFGFKIKEIPYIHEKRKTGKSKLSFYKSYDIAMLSIISYSKVILRVSTFIGFVFSIITFIIGLMTLIQKIINWSTYPIGMATLMVGVFFIGSVQLFFIGLLGEYILNINLRIVKKPLVIEEERINFDE
ncbi:dolichol monophosphate mannose synthase [Brachyspira hampsonii]|uniref:Dolichol monophosphate mannose synthase n=1 Tax=Brachyspira hampsonii TaxID=1287055 RepID=A0A1E5NI14_9SPIR|nr:glycosyltransferase family 2 protein [Brachyspira hampsonii]OEJ15802.1 dolichol monophosphate mannose synthase [Brachyspira hampsonii]